MDNPPKRESSGSIGIPFFWRNRSISVGILLAFACWCGATWWLTGYFTQKREEAILVDHRQDLIESTNNIAAGLHRGLSMLHGIPAAVGQNPQLHRALKRFSDVPRSPLSEEENRRIWSSDPELAALNHWLSNFTDKLGVMSVIWVMNKASDSILASNYRTQASMVGANYRDREYFNKAMAGELGIQYVVGRRTKTPGLFFSAPVIDDDNNLIGVVAGKVDIPFLAPWLGHADGLIIDQYGVVILAQDKELEMRTIPGTTVFNLSEKERMARYVREEFTKLPTTPWSEGRYPDLYRFDNRNIPVLLNKVAVEDDKFFLIILMPVPEHADIDRDRLLNFALLTVSGLLLVVGIALRTAYLGQRQRHEQMLRESDARLATVFRASPIGIALIRWSDRKVIEANDFLLQLFGHMREEIVDRALDEFNFWEDWAEITPLAARLREDGHLHNVEIKISHSDGTIGIYLVFAERVEISGETCYLATATDITSLKRLEEALHEAKDASEMANHAKSMFLANMSHEIRTPINVVLGMAEVLLDTDLNPDQLRFVQTMHHSGQALLVVINDVLDFSRIEAGRFTLDEHPFSPRQVVEEIARLMQMAAEEKGLTLVAQVATDIPDAVLGDDGRLRQVLINLLGNAIKFTHQGGVELTLTSHPRKSATLLFRITDTGIGITPEQATHIFDRFTQADAGITRRYGGTGLGLAISKRLVEMMGGEIDVESHLERGSTFFFTLPTRIVESCPQAVTPVVMITDSAIRSLRILLVEDSEDNQLLFRAYLSKSHHQLAIVNNGLEAVERVRQEEFNLVLMDIQMPVMDGYTATQRIRQWEQEEGRSPMTILALSAHALAEEKEKSLAAGCNDHLTKPIKKQELLKAIQKIGEALEG